MKTILLPEGAGFTDTFELEALVKDLGYQVIKKSFDIEPGILDWPEADTVDGVIFRGFWSAVPEEKLYATLLAKRLEPTLRRIQKRLSNANDKLKVFAIGRGALVFFQSPLIWGESKPLPLSVKWRRALENAPPWVPLTSPHSDFMFIDEETQSGEISRQIYQPLGLVKGRVFPEFDFPNPWGLEKFLMTSQNDVVGFTAYNSKLFLLLCDTLSYSDRTQLEGYGYEDLMKIPNRNLFLNKIFSTGV